MCRKWSITLVTLIILACSKKLDLEITILYMIVGFAGAYVGIQGGADIAAKGREGSTPLALSLDPAKSAPPAP